MGSPTQICDRPLKLIDLVNNRVLFFSLIFNFMDLASFIYRLSNYPFNLSKSNLVSLIVVVKFIMCKMLVYIFQFDRFNLKKRVIFSSNFIHFHFFKYLFYKLNLSDSAQGPRPLTGRTLSVYALLLNTYILLVNS